MDPTLVPEDLSTLTDEELASLGQQIAERAAEIGASEALSDEELTEIEGLAESADRIDTEAATREEVAAAKAERLENALARFKPAEDEAPEAAEDEELEPEAEDDEEIVAEVPLEPEVEEAPVAVAATAAKRPTTGSLTVLKSRRPDAAAPKATEPEQARFHAAAGVNGLDAGAAFGSRFELAQAIAKRRLAMGNVPAGVRDNISIATGLKGGLGTPLSSDPQENFSALRDARADHAAIVASGGNCAPQTPLYDFYRLAVPQSPVQGALNVVAAPRGGIRFITPPDYRDARGAIGIVTEAEDRAGYDPDGPTDPKLFMRVDCPQVQEVQVDAIYWSIRWGNLQYRTFPEQVEAFMEDLAVAFETRKEEKHLDYIDAHSTAVTSVSPYGASRGLLFDWTRLAVAYRKRNGMLRGSTLQVLAPDWAMDLIKADLLNDGDEGLSYLSVPDAAVTSALRDRGLDVTWFNDSTTATAGTQRFAQAQAAGALNAWPTTVRAYFFAPGTFVRLDGGSLDVGLVRDSELNRTNDLELFFEEWLATVMLGIESIRLTSTVCPSGAGAGNTTPFSC